ncbi:MAG: GNAT family N-acetyltransferase [Alphaproteobacteria bacterium]|nr:GNAT family N-acetyltransferase [Alphaproteobacteria bacterium]
MTVAYSCFGPTPCTNHSFDLYWLATLKDYQKKGIGRRLLQQSFQSIKEMGGQRVYIETSGRAQYYPTQMFYKSCGLVQEACLKDYYDIGDDCLIFSYKIKENYPKK